jgi:hypothetical protein
MTGLKQEKTFFKAIKKLPPEIVRLPHFPH